MYECEGLWINVCKLKKWHSELKVGWEWFKLYHILLWHHKVKQTNWCMHEHSNYWVQTHQEWLYDQYFLKEMYKKYIILLLRLGRFLYFLVKWCVTEEKSLTLYILVNLSLLWMKCIHFYFFVTLVFFKGLSKKTFWCNS